MPSGAPPAGAEMKPPGGDDAVEGAAVDDEILDDRKGRGPPRLDREHVTVLEAAHVELTGGRSVARAVGTAVDDHAARAADAFPAVVVEGDRVLALPDQPLVDDVEHLEEGHLLVDVAGLVGDEAARGFRVLLAPDLESDLHL